MHEALQAIATELSQISVAIATQIPTDEPFNIAHGNWSFPGITKSELNEQVKILTQRIEERGGDTLGLHEPRIRDYVRRLQFLRSNTIPNLYNNAALGVPAFQETINGLARTLEPAFKLAPEIAHNVYEDVSKLRSRATAMEKRLNDLAPRSERLESMLVRIEKAYAAADQLPSELEQLAQDKERINSLLQFAEKDYLAVKSNRNDAADAFNKLKSSADEAKSFLDQCHSAYAAGTSQGLAAAFAERSSALERSMVIWVGGFIIALGAGAYFGAERMHELTSLMKSPNLTVGTAILNLLLAVISVGAPIWFGWLASKQIGQRFRLSEDYAYKAAVSRAYEGYRREAARFDKEMEARLLSSALSRLDEQPLRFVEPNSHASPWHELASSELVKGAIKSVPGFADRITDAAKEALGGLKLVSSTEKASTKSADEGTPKH